MTSRARLTRFIAANWPVLLLPASLAVSAYIVSAKKPFWNDELYSWHFVSSDFHTMWAAFQEPINNSPFLYFGLGWLWAQAFGASELSLRLFSSFGFATAAMCIWMVLRPVYGFWPGALALFSVFCTSELVFAQNAEARMYGLFVALAAAATYFYHRMYLTGRPSTSLLALNTLVHAALVHTHLFGLFYSAGVAASFAVATVLRDGFVMRRLVISWPVFGSFAAAWSTFVLYLPAFFAQAEAGRPYSWLPRPAFEDLLPLLTNGSGAFFRPEALVIIVLLVALCAVLDAQHEANGSLPHRKDRHLLWLALVLAALPAAVWAVSIVARPIFFDRYLMPSLLAWVILIAHVLARALRDEAVAPLLAPRNIALGTFLLGLLCVPVVEARSYWGWQMPGRQDNAAFGRADLPIVVQSSHDFLERHFYAREQDQYVFVLDWKVTNTPASGRFGIQEYKHMEAYRHAFPDRFDDQIVNAEAFLAEHDEFLILSHADYTRSCTIGIRGVRRALVHGISCPQWAAWLVKDPRYAVREIAVDARHAYLHVMRRRRAQRILSRPSPVWRRLGRLKAQPPERS